jgi:tetratricopeptide (TPR) repeat protein
VHAAFAAALEERPDLAKGNAATVAAEIAHHRLRAGDQPRALGAAVRAGAEAERVGALAEAADHFAHALELWPAVPDPDRRAGMDRATVLARAAHATAWTGRPSEAIGLVDEALALVDAAAEPARAALLHQRRGQYLWWAGGGHGDLADYERAIELIPAEPPSPELAGALEALGLMLTLTGEHARARDCCEQAIAVARRVGSRVEEAGALNSLGMSLIALGDRPGGIACLREARNVARQADDPDMVARTAIGLSDGLRRAGRLAEAVEVGLEGGREAHRAGLELVEGFCRLNAAESAFELGRWELVDELVGDVLAREVGGLTLTFAHHMAAELAVARGEFEAAEHHLAAERSAVGPDATSEVASYGFELGAELALWRSQPEAGARYAEEGLRRVGGEEPHIWTLMALVALRAEADRAELARARRDEAAAGASCGRARELREAARARTEAAGHAPAAATLEAEYARALRRADPALWKVAADAWEARPSP